MAHFSSNHPHVSSFETHFGVSVTHSETESFGNRKYTLYRISVKPSGGTNATSQAWIVRRRYHDFSQLYEVLKKSFPDVSLTLPGKRLLLNNFDARFIEHRRSGLHTFMQQVAQDPRLLRHPRTVEFLDLSNYFALHPASIPDKQTPPSTPERRSFEPNLVNLGPSERHLVKPTDFEFLKVIGKGSFGKVLLSRYRPDQKVYAVKVLQKQQIRKNNEIRHIMSEKNILLKNIQHPFLVGLHYSFQTSDKLYFVLDYVNGGELFHHLQREKFFSEPRSRFYAAEISSALGYLHDHGIIYRDLKPENLLLDSEGHIRLTDFGLCKEGINTVDGGTTTTFCGTPEYLAPEILRKQPYTATVDWWCLGAVLYEMLYGLPPFYSRDTAEMYDSILHKPLRLRSTASEVARDLLHELLQKDPRFRLGNEGGFEDVRSHPFFRSIDWAALLDRKVKPPYNPNVSGIYDLRHIDPEFTLEPVPASVSNGVFHGPSSMDNAFLGFTYVPPIDGI